MAARSNLNARSLAAKKNAGEQLGSCAAGKMKCTTLFVQCGKLILAAIYLRRVGIDGRSYSAACSAACSANVQRTESYTVVGREINGGRATRTTHAETSDLRSA